MNTVHNKACECHTSILGQLHRNRMTSKMAIKTFTILTGYRYNIHLLSMLLPEMVTSAEINLINLYQYTLKIIQKQSMPPRYQNFRTALSFSSSTFTPFTVLRIIGSDVPRNQAHLKLGSWSKEVLKSTVFLVYPAQASITENCNATYPCLTDTERILSRFL